ncbi:MAG: pyruvate ferredoxin oxidoreductase [Candidatus Zixiibacteriota bacterium]|nr:MAG: pyruvate ferredoxin oxidoreductase [candidate division Zixibacteria bacterium]
MMKKVLEGSMAVAEAVKACRPHVISAYPITPQTHIVENLSQMVADGDLKAEFINVESEFAAASVILGASATGARAYSTTTAQGLLLMAEVLFNIAGLRLPVTITCANRAVSAPINIWNDHQDSMTVRDSGWLQLYAEDCQEAADMQLQAYKIGENPEISLPVLVNMDGFILTHAFEPVELFDQKMADEFLPPYKPEKYLSTKDPVTFGILAEPTYYAETRYRLQQAIEASKPVIDDVADDFKAKFGRYSGGLVDKYRLEDADVAMVAMGSVVGTMREVVDELREKGEKVGLLKVRAFRPFPKEAIYDALKEAETVVVMEKALSLGLGGILLNEMKTAFYGEERQPKMSGFIVGLGGRDIPNQSIADAVKKARSEKVEDHFVDLKEELIGIGE